MCRKLQSKRSLRKAVVQKDHYHQGYVIIWRWWAAAYNKSVSPCRCFRGSTHQSIVSFVLNLSSVECIAVKWWIQVLLTHKESITRSCCSSLSLEQTPSSSDFNASDGRQNPRPYFCAKMFSELRVRLRRSESDKSSGYLSELQVFLAPDVLCVRPRAVFSLLSCSAGIVTKGGNVALKTLWYWKRPVSFVQLRLTLALVDFWD